MENTSKYLDGEAILVEIALNELYYKKSECFALVKYLVSEYSCLNVDVLLAIAEKLYNNFEMVRWVMSITEHKIFYIAWKNQKWIHKEICELKLIYDTEFYKTLDRTTIIKKELKYRKNDCIKFLLRNIDMQRAETEVVERVCSSDDEHLMQMMFTKFRSLNIIAIISIAVRKQN
ncbi:unnamed protein product [Mytilus coruscus]|uniref:Uncharacterized protein n=1 Tax=Mytilus coruscus TaxID=42192 RepID=A0A6J8EUN5_MYTCO|nr:unnamed protein product [Mytilus coruscus]